MIKIMNLKTYKTLVPFVIVLVVTIVWPIVTSANHQNMGQYGERPIYGHFGQPHGHVLSGSFTFTVQTKGKVDRVSFKAFKADETSLDIGKAVLNTQQTSVTNASDDNKYFNLVWNSANTPDGDYKLFANVECDSCATNGWQDFAVHFDGKSYLEFKIKNPVVVVPPVTIAPEDTCKNDLVEANTLSSNIYEKQKSNLLFVDNFFQQTVLFYEKNNLKIDNYEDITTEIGGLRKDASDSVVIQETLKNFTCQKSLKEQVENYLEKNTETRNRLDLYKDSVISLILKVLEKI